MRHDRRRFLIQAAGGGLAALLAACGGAPASPTAAPAKPTEAPKPAATTAPAAAPTTAPTAAAKPAEPTKPAAPAAPAAPTPTPVAAAPKPAAPVAGKVLIWRGRDFSENINPLLRTRWQEYASKNNVTLDWDESLQLAADALPAAVQAGQPPDITGQGQTTVHFWRAQNQLVDVSDIVKPHANKEGGFWKYKADTMAWQGNWYAVPLGVGTWPWHVRQDLLDQHNGGKWVTTWEEMRELAKKVNKPPFNAYGIPLGPCQDANHSFAEIVWTFGGKLQNEDGTLGLKDNDEAVLAALDLLEKMYLQDKTIPEGAINWNDGGNNQAYQGELVAWIMNPPSVFVWAKANKPDLFKNTTLTYAPKGPGGSYTTVQSEGFGIFKGAKNIDAAKGLLEYTLQPEWYVTFIEQLDGRYGPVYKNMLERPYWQQPRLKEIAYITKNGRILAADGAPLVAFSDIANKFYIPTMIADVLVKKMSKQEALAAFMAKAKDAYAKNPPK